ncbi:MAG: threonine ammonia-lyase, biosynthetic [Mariprofundales bacterium]
MSKKVTPATLVNYADAIDKACVVYDVAIKSELQKAPRLSARLHNNVLLKREDMQPVFSFKLRGAYNKIYNLSSEERARGVLCASAGNHAQGVALAAQKMKIAATIVMPRTTPEIKIKAVKSYGAQVVLFGDSYSDASGHAEKLCTELGMVFVHPYDDPLVIAGQGTIAKELLAQAKQQDKRLDAIFIPIGGGGLAAGIAAYIKHHNPQIKIIGVEPFDSAAMSASVKAGQLVTLEQVGIFADGVAVKKVGSNTFSLVRELIDDIVLVSTDEICAAIKDVFEETRSIVEPAGALAVAGMKVWLAQNNMTNKTLVCINSGANMNFDRLFYVSERAEIGERHEALFAVTIPERAGAFMQFCRSLGDNVITEFNYRFSTRKAAHVFVGVRVNDVGKEIALLHELFAEQHYDVIDLNDNELAKEHLRHMVGGRSSDVQNELLFSFVFPERPGALLDFLQALAGRWNISLFHYRNHGAAFGRVLCGMEVPPQDAIAFQIFLEQTGYEYKQENDAAFRLFL